MGRPNVWAKGNTFYSNKYPAEGYDSNKHLGTECFQKNSLK